MQILAGSEAAAEGVFLHAGYLSAYPHTFEMSGVYLLVQNTLEALPVRSSLALKPAAAGTQSPPTKSPAAKSAPLGQLGSDATAYLLALIFFVLLASAHLLGNHPVIRLRAVWVGIFARRRAVWAGGLVAVAAVVLLALPASGGAKNTLPPWEGVVKREYADPVAATKVILHGLIGGALVGSPMPVRRLADLAPQVAFPVPAAAYTPGMEYASRMYAFDGWGREFRYVPLKDSCEVRSSGADGNFGNADDLVLKFLPNESWEMRLVVVGVYATSSAPAQASPDALLVHRVEHQLFRFNDAKGAEQLTGGKLYDRIALQANPHKAPEYNEWVEAVRTLAQGIPASERDLLLLRVARFKNPR